MKFKEYLHEADEEEWEKLDKIENVKNGSIYSKINYIGKRFGLSGNSAHIPEDRTVTAKSVPNVYFLLSTLKDKKGFKERNFGGTKVYLSDFFIKTMKELGFKYLLLFSGVNAVYFVTEKPKHITTDIEDDKIYEL